jgi:1,4-dihydroxy-2-naphthoate polyprenyltransferase
VMTGNVTAGSVAVSIPVTFFVSNLLLLNQFPDIDADKRVGRTHLSIAWGVPLAGKVYTLMMLSAYIAIVAACLLGILPFQSKLALLTLPLGIWVALKVLAFTPTEVDRLIPAMGVNVAVTLLTPVLLGIGLFWAAS